MNIDLTPLVQALAALALAAMTAATPYLAPLLRRYLHLQLTATQSAAVQAAADAGAQAAYGYIAASTASYHDVTIRNAAIATGVQHVDRLRPRGDDCPRGHAGARAGHGGGALRRPARRRSDDLDRQAGNLLTFQFNNRRPHTCDIVSHWRCSSAWRRAATWLPSSRQPSGKC